MLRGRTTASGTLIDARFDLGGHREGKETGRKRGELWLIFSLRFSPISGKNRTGPNVRNEENRGFTLHTIVRCTLRSRSIQQKGETTRKKKADVS
jgi:hypothetical protein